MGIGWAGWVEPIEFIGHVDDPADPGYDPVAALGAKLLAWWNADRSDLITLSGVQVTSWKDVVGAYDCAQGVSGSRPIFGATSFNGSPGVSFDGTDDELTLGSTPLPTGANPCEIWVVASQNEVAVGNGGIRRFFTYGGTSDNDHRSVFRSAVSDVNRAYARTGLGSSNVSRVQLLVDLTGRHLIRGIFSATTVNVEVDGASSNDPADAVSATGTTRTRIGANTANTAGHFMNGVMRDVLVTTNDLTGDEAAALEAYLLARRNL